MTGHFAIWIRREVIFLDRKTITLPEEIEAPVVEGQAIGEAVYKLNGQRIGGVSIVAVKNVEKAGYKDYVIKVIHSFFL